VKKVAELYGIDTNKIKLVKIRKTENGGKHQEIRIVSANMNGCQIENSMKLIGWIKKPSIYK
jgi:hypothetical protein